MIYLDNAATTLHKPRAVDEAVRRAMHAAAGYARGGYAAAMRAGETVYACREQAAALFGRSHCAAFSPSCWTRRSGTARRWWSGRGRRLQTARSCSS